MSLLSAIGGALGLASTVAGFFGDKKTNKLAKKQFETEKRLADRQIEISKYIEALAKEVAGRKGDVSDIYGNRAYYDDATGTYKTELGGVQRKIQDASDVEELMRQVLDNAIRRRGLNDFEAMRQRSGIEANTALERIGAFRRGIGNVDPGRVGSQLRADRTRAINAGYDDAARAATTLGLRTGSSAVTDALANLGRARSRSLATDMGSPELEGLKFAEDINTSREGRMFDIYNMFGNEARNFYDNPFNPSVYGERAEQRLADAMKFDLSKYDLAMGGSGSAASTIGNAAAGLRQGYGQFMGNRISSPTSNFLQGLSGIFGSMGNKSGSGGLDISKLLAALGG